MGCNKTKQLKPCNNCGACEQCCPTPRPCTLIDYHALVDPDNKQSRFNENNQSSHNIETALIRGQQEFLNRSCLDDKCFKWLCQGVMGECCPTPCQAALIYKIMPALTAFIEWQYVEIMSSADFSKRDPDPIEDPDKLLKILYYYERKAKKILEDLKLEDFLRSTKVKDVDKTQPHNENRCYTCFEIAPDTCDPCSDDHSLDIPFFIS